MPRCDGIKRDGGRCEVVVSGQQTYCYHHDPATAEKRKRVASKGGKSKPNRELADIKRRLSVLADAVLDGSQNRANAAVAGQLLNILIRVVSVELKVREVDELEARLEELESLLERQNKRGA
jgi:hypothetical protein